MKTESRAKSAEAASSVSTRSRDVVTATAEVQHCLDVGLEDVSLLGLQPEHLRAVVEGAKGSRVCVCVRTFMYVCVCVCMRACMRVVCVSYL